MYRARDTRLDRTIAIKILSSDLSANVELRERFEREARVVAALNHPHICTLYDVGRQEGTDFLVMEYLEGETLEERMRRPEGLRLPGEGTRRPSGVPIGEALTIAVQIASALDAAHRAGIVHRDLKPGNIMLTKSGSVRQGSAQAKLLDFGLAKTTTKAVAGRLSMLPTTPPGLTAQGTILGTLQYMAPEQLEGQDADARTDIFSFGAVLYEMVHRKEGVRGKESGEPDRGHSARYPGTRHGSAAACARCSGRYRQQMSRKGSGGAMAIDRGCSICAYRVHGCCGASGDDGINSSFPRLAVGRCGWNCRYRRSRWMVRSATSGTGYSE